MPFTPHTKEDVVSMLETIGLKDESELFDSVPKELRAKSFDLPEGLSEFEAYDKIKEIAKKNSANKTLFMGGGYYDHIVPSCVDALSMRSEFYTAYTPYQAEASQGTLQALYEYQTLVCKLTGMDVTNASMYDGGTALAEAALMAVRIRRRDKVLLDKFVNPIYKEIVKTYLSFRDIEVIEVEDATKHIDETIACYLFQNPNFLGSIKDYEEISDMLHQYKALSISLVYPISLGLIKPPKGVDIVCADGQSLGNYLGFGGPSFGIIAAKNEFVRNIPGRIVGKTIDKDGKEAFVLTLQAREQHIRRERATSNICSNQNLMALRATIFMSALGESGFKEMANLNFQKSQYLKSKLSKLSGVKIYNQEPTFNEFVIETPVKASNLLKELSKRGIYGGIDLGRVYEGFENRILVAVTEKRTKEQMDRFAKLLGELI